MLCLAALAQAQSNGQIFSAQRPDRSGDGPEKGPPITVSVARDGDTVRVLVAANDIDGEPVPCTFYVNNHFFAEQADPPQGIFVGPDVATPPFSVKVLCRDLWGNATVARLAITNREAQETYNCIFSSSDINVSAEDISASQVGDSGLSLAYEGANTEVEGQNASVTASISTDADKATANVTVVRNGVTQTFSMQGTAELKEDGRTIDSFEVQTETKEATLSCS